MGFLYGFTLEKHKKSPCFRSTPPWAKSFAPSFSSWSRHLYIGGYTRIPDICLRQIRALRRWCMNKWWATGERKLFFAQKRWMVPD